jgi:hypothetical protein
VVLTVVALLFATRMWSTTQGVTMSKSGSGSSSNAHPAGENAHVTVDLHAIDAAGEQPAAGFEGAPLLP